VSGMAKHIMFGCTTFLLEGKTWPCAFLEAGAAPCHESQPGTGSQIQTAGSPKYFYLIFNFIIMSRVSRKQHHAFYLLIISYVDFFTFL